MIYATLSRIDRAVAVFCRWFVIACFMALFVLLSIGILQRMLPILKLNGHDEMIELLFIWMTFIGSLALWREGSLYRVEMIDRLQGPRGRQALAIVTHVCMLALAVVLAVAGWDFMRQSGETSPFLQVDKIYWYAAIPVCGAFMAVYSLAALWRALLGNLRTPQDFITLG